MKNSDFFILQLKILNIRLFLLNHQSLLMLSPLCEIMGHIILNLWNLILKKFRIPRLKFKSRTNSSWELGVYIELTEVKKKFPTDKRTHQGCQLLLFLLQHSSFSKWPGLLCPPAPARPGPGGYQSRLGKLPVCPAWTGRGAAGRVS